LLYILLFTSAIEIKKPYGIRHEPVLELRIESTLCGQTWSMVHLDQPGLQLVIYHDVKAQDLEAKLIFNILWLTAAVEMRKRRMTSYECFDNDLLELFLQDLNL